MKRASNPRWQVLGYSLLLFSVNVLIAGRLFATEFTNNLDSVEGSFIAIARWMMEHPAEHTWWPLWNSGLPFHCTYLPLLPAMVAAWGKLSGASPALAYHAVTAALYCLGPVAVFWMAAGLSGHPRTSFVGGLVYSVVSPSALLLPAIRSDLGGMWDSQRLYVLIHYGAGPQVSALALTPLAILSVGLALRHRRPLLYLCAGVSLAAVVLTNAFGAVSLALAVGCLILARPVREMFRDLALMVAIAVVSYLAICPWLPPSFLRVIEFNSQTAGGDFRWSLRSLTAIALVLVPLAACWWLTRHWKLSREGLRFFLLFSVVLTMVVTLSLEFNLHAIPQGWRFHLEMEMALTVLAALLAAEWWDRAPRPARAALLGVCLVGIGWQALHTRRYAGDLIQPIDVHRTVEYKTAMWLQEDFGDERVMATGSPSFWLNVFTEQPQLSGGHEPFNPNWMSRVAIFIIYSGLNAGERDAEVAVLWLKAFGVHGINVPGPASEEPYKLFQRNYTMFDGRLPVVRREEGNTIYRVPQRSASLARIVPGGATVDRPPAHGLDTEQVERYVAALEDPSLPLASWEWRNAHSAAIRADIAPGQVISVQVTYDPGWRATIDGREQRLHGDGIGLMVIEPDRAGPSEIELTYDGGVEGKATRWLSLLTVVGVLVWLVFSYRRRAFHQPW